MLALRDYQTDLIAAARAEMRKGCRRLLLQGPTGMGKTALTAHMLAGAAQRGKRAWFIVHRRELLAQAVETFVTAADLHVGIIAAGYPSDASAPVQVCSVGSLRKRIGKVAAPDLIVLDECHHTPSASWSAITSALPNAIHIGLTATPQRLDGRGLGAYFDALLCGPSTADLIAAGWLAPYRLYAPAQFDASKLHKVAGDYNRKEVTEALGKSTVVGDAVGTYLRYAEDGQALVFAWSLAASQAIADAFVMAGVPAAHVDGETPVAQRADAMRRFRNGELRVITSVDLFGEGLDVPAVDAIFQLRPTSSLSLCLQQWGRGMRMSPGKAHVKIFDHVGNYTRHGLPDDARVWTLDGVSRATAPREQPLKRCVSCYAVASVSARQCPACGAAYPVKARKVIEVAGELQETELSALRGRVTEFARECKTLTDWQALGKKLGYAPGWAWFRWQHSTARKRSESGRISGAESAANAPRP